MKVTLQQGCVILRSLKVTALYQVMSIRKKGLKCCKKNGKLVYIGFDQQEG